VLDGVRFPYVRAPLLWGIPDVTNRNPLLDSRRAASCERCSEPGACQAFDLLACLHSQLCNQLRSAQLVNSFAFWSVPAKCNAQNTERNTRRTILTHISRHSMRRRHSDFLFTHKTKQLTSASNLRPFYAFGRFQTSLSEVGRG
jgi:hypothetical protein